MNVNKKLLQQELVKETGNVILLKDLTNISSTSKRGKSRNDLDVTVDTLMKRYGKCIQFACRASFVGGIISNDPLSTKLIYVALANYNLIHYPWRFHK